MRADPLDVQAEQWDPTAGVSSRTVNGALPPQPRPFVRPSAGDKGGPLYPDDESRRDDTAMRLFDLILAFAAGVAVGWVVWG